MMPTPLQRLDLYYTHIPEDRIEGANKTTRLADLSRRVFGKTREPVIPYTLKNPDAALRFTDYPEALAALGLDQDDMEHRVRPGLENIYTEPKSDPEGRGYGRHLKWAAYVSPDTSHMVLEIGSPYHIMGFCFAQDGDAVILDQISVGNIDTHYTVDPVKNSDGACNLRKTMLEIATITIQGLRKNPKGSEGRFSAMAKSVIEYIQRDMDNQISTLRSAYAVQEIQANLMMIGDRLDALDSHIQGLSDNTLPAALAGIESLQHAAKTVRMTMDGVAMNLSAAADSAAKEAQKIKDANPGHSPAPCQNKNQNQNPHP